MRNSLLSALAAGAFAVLTIAPAFAACNPGTPNCITIAPGGRLAQIKSKLTNPGTLGSGELDCQNTKLCGIDTGNGTSPGVPAMYGSPTTPSIPMPPPGTVRVR
jgi:hypothetical protein